MTALSEIENAIERLTPRERTQLAQWWQQRFDPDQGLELREDIGAELDAARRQIARGDVADWAQLKRHGKAALR